jgi:hypothetical protein
VAPTDFIIQVRGILTESITPFAACIITGLRHLIWAGIAGVMEPMGPRVLIQGSAPLDPDPNPPPPLDNSLPSVPNGLTANVSGQSVALSWTAATDNIGVDHYAVYRSDVSGYTAGPATLLAIVSSGLSYFDSGVPVGTWYYRISAADAAGNESAASAQVPAVVSVVVSGTPSAGLWFEKLPSGYGSKKLMPHFYPPFVISIQNDPTPDYYDKNWLTPAIEGGVDYRAVGGYIRDKPLDQYEGARPQPTATWRAQDAEQNVQQAMDHGLDGFWLEMLGTLGGQQQVRNAALAAAADKLAPNGSFKVSPQPDTNNSGINGLTAAGMADELAVFAVTNPTAGLASYTRRPSSWYLPDGRFVISCFMGDNWNVARWQALFDAMFTRYKVRLALINCLSNWGNAPAYAGFQYGSGMWGYGSGDEGITRGSANQAAEAHARGEKYMMSIWPSDIRPVANVARSLALNDAAMPPGTGNVALFDEANNTGSLRAHLERMISDGADYALGTTWSDYREGGMSQGSQYRGHVIQAIMAWYSYKWKTGAFPPILTDCVILSHRNQPFPTGATYRYDASGLYARKMAHWNRGSNTSPIRNNVEALTFLTAPAQVTIRSGVTSLVYTAPAGQFVNSSLPLAMGAQSVTVARGGVTVASIASPVTATSTPLNQNPFYAMFSSCELPQWFSKQRDPTANL